MRLIKISFLLFTFGLAKDIQFNSQVSALKTNREPISGDDALPCLKILKIGKVIIDTDGGLDNMISILLALGAKNLEILAITTTDGSKPAKNVCFDILRTLKVVNSKKPIHLGSHTAVLETQMLDNEIQKDSFEEIKDDNPPELKEIQTEHAVSAMVRLVHEYPNEVSIIVLGPLTNLAGAMRIDRNFKKTVKQIIWVGGSVNGIGNVGPSLEFNARFDPVANFIVFNETGPAILMVPWEFLLYESIVPIDWRKNVLGKLQSPQIKFLNKMETEILDPEIDNWLMANAMKAVAMAINPLIVTKASFYHLEPIFEGELTKGLTLVDYNDHLKRKCNVMLVESIDVKQFQKIMEENLNAKIVNNETVLFRPKGSQINTVC